MKVKRRIWAWALAVLAAFSLVVGTAIPAFAAAGSTPPHTKLLTDNHDGTYTLSLDVVGESERKPNPVNVIVILDHSGSMDERTGGYGSQTRMAAAQNAVNNLARSLFNYNTSEFPELVEMALVGFSTTGSVTQAPTTSYNTFSGAVNGLDADGGTNWEDAIQDAAGINFGDEDPTYVIFVSDGNPTFRNTRGNYNPLDNYYYNTYGVYGNGSDSQAHQGIPVATTITRCYDHAVDDARTLATAVGTDHFYTIGAYGNVDRMQSLTTAAGAPAGNYFSAANTTDLQNALAAILAQIEKAGIGSVEIEDGTTNQVTASSGVVELLEVDTSSFKYYKDGAAWADAPKAQFVDGAVEWDLSSVGVLDDGVKYTVTFDCYPSQYTYDTIAQLKNGDIKYSELDPEVQKYIVDNGNGTYSLRTNTAATLDWDDTRTDDDEKAVAYTNPDPVRTDAATMSVSKEWENTLDARTVGSIDMTVLMGTTEFHKVTLTDPEWSVENIYISPGIIKNGQVLPGAEGHDFTFAELGSEQYNWELVSPVVHPMLINGTLTMLTLVDEAHPAPSGAQTYQINGKTYYSNGTSAASLDAYNYRRSNLNLTKVVTGEDAPKDATFPFTLTVNNSKASSGSASDTNSDYYVWFSIYDTNAGATVTNATVTGATGPSSSGYYYAPSGTAITVQMKAGWNLRFTNLPTGTTYTFAEGNLADGFAFNKAQLTSGTDKDTSFSGGKTSTGTIQATNTSYVVTYTNDYQLTDLEITKVWNDASNQDGIRPTAEEFAEMLTLDPAVEGAAPTVVDNGDDTYTITYTGLPRFNNGTEVEYTVAEGTIDGYTTEGSPAKDHETITNTHTPEVTNVTVIKEWANDDFTGNIRPASIQAQLKADGENSGTPVTLNAANEWTYTWEGLPKFKDGKEIVYTADETAVPTSYSKTVSDPVTTDEGVEITVTNTYAPESTTASFPVKKVVSVPEGLTGPATWSYTINVAANAGAPEAETMTGTVSNTADTATFGPITYTMPGTYTYTVSETGTVAGVTNDAEAAGKTVTVTVVANSDGTLTATADSTDANALTFTNTYAAEPTTASFPVEKILSVAEGLTAPDITGKYTIALAAVDGAPMPETTSYTNPDADGGTVTFGAITYTAPGTYAYTVTESGEVKGINNDSAATTGKTVTVTVTDNGDGTLTATPSSTADEPVSFTNTYEVGQATASIPVEKVVSVPEGLAGPTDWTYTATVTAKDGAPVAQTMTAELTKANPSASIGEITYTKPGTYKYTVTESGTVAGITNGTASYDIEVVVTDNSDGTLTAVVNGDKAVTFTNTYSVEPTTAKFPVVKDLVVPEGLEGPEDASWTVTLTGANNAPMPTTTTGTITSEEGATFGDITYTLPGTYTYTVTESGTVAGVTNDAEPAKTVTVTVVDNGNGTLTATPSATEEAPVTFTNTYSVEPTTANIPVEKVMSVPEGMTGPTQWSYTITAAANDGAPVAEQMSATVTNTQKTATIGEITYTKPGTYTYTVTESGTVAGVTNDAEATTGKTVTVTVVDNHDGTMTATVSATENEPVTFTNTYNAEPTTAEFPVKKILSVPEGLEGPTEWEYTINVEAQDDAPEAETMSGKVNKTTDTVTFGDFTFTKPGTYKYTVTETGTVAGVTNDPSTGKTVTIQVVDNHDGTMTATASATEDEPVTFTNTYKVDPTTAEFPVKKVLSVPAGQTGPASWTYTIDVKANDGAPAAETMTGTVTNTTDTVTFGDFTYEKPGTYTYTVTESGTVAGVTNDSEATTGKTVTVTVVDNHDGTLTATANSTAAKPLSFTNVYGVQPATAKFPVQKVLEVPETLDGPAEWSYTIDVTAEDGAPEASTMTGTVDQDNDTVTFGDFTYTEPGTYTYTVSETGTIDGVTNDAEAAGKTVTVTVVDNGDGTLTATADSTEEEPLQFTNTYSVEPTTAKFPVEKVMSVPEGVDGPKAWSYDIAVVANDDAPEAETMTGKVDQATTSVTFGDFTYTEPGTYTYTVSETGTVAGVTNDTEASGKTVTVTVVDNGDGTLTATADSTTDSPLQFTNTYAASGTVTLEATKVAKGFDLKADQFTFQLKDADGELIEEAQNDANGKVAFSELSYTSAGVYTYTINEVVTEGDDIADDTHVCNVTVTVVDNGDGTLTATASYDNNKFVNTHDETQKDVVSAKDTEISVDGELVQAGDTLTYTITYANNTAGEATVTVTDTIPTNTTYVEGSASDGGEYADGVITWTIDKVPAGGTGTVTFQVTVDEAAAGTTIENTGNVDDGENKSSSNSVTTSVPVKDVKNGDTSIDGDGVQVGDTLTYEVSFTLTEDATSVVVTDDVPANTTLVDGSISEGGTVADGKITWDLGALTAGDYTVSFKVTVDESAVTVDAITNTASISVNNHSEVKTNTVTNNAEKGGLTITKTVTVPEGFEIDKDAVFTFTINLTDKNGVALEGEYAYNGSSEGTVTNGSTVTLKHGESITIAGLPAGAKYEIVESEASGYTPAQGTISGTIPEGDTASETAAFENAYSTEAAKLELKAAKLLKVKDPANNPPDVSGAYTIAIEGSKDAPMPATTSFKNADGNGTATSFGEISFTKPGEYQYTITEEGTVKGVENGTASYTVRVKVTDQKDGSLKAEIVEGEATTTFENTYSVTPVTLPTEDQFHVSKNLTGTPLSAGAFEFTLTGADGAPMPAKTEATNDADGNVTFDTITYAKPGTYTYTIAEKDGGKGGYTYDTNTVTVTVVVTDNGEGALEAVVSYSDDTEFDNSYAASGEVYLTAEKRLSGRGIEEGQFTFELVDENGKVLQTKTNNGSGSVQFDAIEYTEGIFDEKKADEATAEDKTEAEGTDTEITDQAVEAPVEDAAQAVGETEAVETEAAPVETEAAEVATEAAEAEAAPAEVEAEPEAAEAEDDGFSVSDIAGFISRNVFAPKVAWAEEAAELEAAEAGRTKTFTYTIREVNDGAAGYTYDTHEETVTVTVTDNDDGSLTAVEAYDEDGAVFTNAYEATGSVQFGGTKAIETETDRTLAEGEFTFQLKDADGKVVEEVKNTADGSFQFSALNYVQNAEQKDADTGTFTYTIVEVNDGKDGFTYDSHVCDVTVTVTDNGDGTLACVAELSDGEAASFVNPYTPLATTIKLEATKQLTGRSLKAGEFTFELSDADGKVIATVKNAADGSINFGEIMFTEEGEYTFTAKEVKGTDANVTYDESVLTYVVTVVDNDGQLEATLEDGKDYVFKNKYTEPPSTPKRKKVLPQTSDDSMPTSVVIATGIAGASLVAAGLSMRLRKEED